MKWWKFFIVYLFMGWVILVTLGGEQCPQVDCSLSTTGQIIAWSYFVGALYIQYLWRKYRKKE